MKYTNYILQNLSWLCICLPVLSGCAQEGEGINPGLVEVPVVYAKRTIPVDEDGVPVHSDVRNPLSSDMGGFSAGGDLYIRSTTSATATEKNITRSVTQGIGDVRDVNASADGKKVVFSLRLADPDPNDPLDDPTWDIYEYDVTADMLRRVIPIDADAIEGNDISPAYLPDGRIVFSSDRQRNARQVITREATITGGLIKPSRKTIVEDRQQPGKAMLLHVIDANGDANSIKQITFNQSHDLDPTIMPDGRILFSRWEFKHIRNANAVNLYTVKPDGTDLQLYYGDQGVSHVDANGVPLQLTKPRVLSDGRVLVVARPYTNTFGGGEIQLIDGKNYLAKDRPIHANENIMNGPGQVKATMTNVDNRDVTTGNISKAGRYSSAFPLQDGSNRMIVSKGLCRVTTDDVLDPNIVVIEHPCMEPYISTPGATERPPAYGLWIYDLSNNTERPLFAAEKGYILTDAIVLQPYNTPPVIGNEVLVGNAAAWASQNVGILHIRSVYDRDGVFNCNFAGSIKNCGGVTSIEEVRTMDMSADERPARFLRIVKAVGIPDPDDTNPDLANTSFGRNRNMGMREIIGYTTIEPDGSVKVKVPSDVAFEIDILDKDGKRIGPRHDGWLQVKAGETLNCVGCHDATAQPRKPHGRTDAMAESINSGMPGGMIANTQIPGTTSFTSTYVANYQETMAEVRTRTLPAGLTPSVDLIFDDNWTTTDPSFSRLPDTSFSYTYGNLTTPMPVDGDGMNPSPCFVPNTWDSGCRAVINYVQHIQPIWDAGRTSGACISCHNPAEMIARNSSGFQLDLTDAISDEEVDHVESYRELLFDDNEQEVVGGILQDRLVDDLNSPILDVNNNPTGTFLQIPVIVPRTMDHNGARLSSFLTKLRYDPNVTCDVTNTGVHTSCLTQAELRLIAEWLDLGAQYFNNPFDTDALEN